MPGGQERKSEQKGKSCSVVVLFAEVQAFKEVGGRGSHRNIWTPSSAQAKQDMPREVESKCKDSGVQASPQETLHLATCTMCKTEPDLEPMSGSASSMI